LEGWVSVGNSSAKSVSRFWAGKQQTHLDDRGGFYCFTQGSIISH